MVSFRSILIWVWFESARFLGGSDGPTVNSNAQIGAENRQSVMFVEKTTSAGRDIVSKEVETGSVGSLDIINTNIPPWVMLLLY